MSMVMRRGRQMFWDWNELEILEFGDCYVLFPQHHRGTRALFQHCLTVSICSPICLNPSFSFYFETIRLRRGLGTCFYLLCVQAVTQQCPRL